MELEAKISSANEEVASVLDYFGEDPARNPTDFFTTLASFCTVGPHLTDGAITEWNSRNAVRDRHLRVRGKWWTSKMKPHYGRSESSRGDSLQRRNLRLEITSHEAARLSSAETGVWMQQEILTSRREAAT